MTVEWSLRLHCTELYFLLGVIVFGSQRCLGQGFLAWRGHGVLDDTLLLAYDSRELWKTVWPDTKVA